MGYEAAAAAKSVKVSARQIGVVPSAYRMKPKSIARCASASDSACASQGKVEMVSNSLHALKDRWNGDSHRSAQRMISSSALTAASSSKRLQHEDMRAAVSRGYCARGGLLP